MICSHGNHHMKSFHVVKELVYPQYCSPRTQGKLLFQEGEQTWSTPSLGSSKKCYHPAKIKTSDDSQLLWNLKPTFVAWVCYTYDVRDAHVKTKMENRPVLGGMLVVASRNWSPDQPLIYMLAWSNMDIFNLIYKSESLMSYVASAPFISLR